MRTSCHLVNSSRRLLSQRRHSARYPVNDTGLVGLAPVRKKPLSGSLSPPAKDAVFSVSVSLRRHSARYPVNDTGFVGLAPVRKKPLSGSLSLPAKDAVFSVSVSFPIPQSFVILA